MIKHLFIAFALFFTPSIVEYFYPVGSMNLSTTVLTLWMILRFALWFAGLVHVGYGLFALLQGDLGGWTQTDTAPATPKVVTKKPAPPKNIDF